MEYSLEELENELREAKYINKIFEIRNKYLGKDNPIINIDFSKISTEEKRVKGKEMKYYEEKANALINAYIELLKHPKEEVDCTLPVYENGGHKHLISLTIEEIKNILTQMNFTFKDSPEMDTEYRCFDLLNMKTGHPARENMQSFYLDSKKVLRPHTSSIQSYFIKGDNIQFFTVGKTFRRDDDATHVPMFHQYEIVYIKEDASMTHLVSTARSFLNNYFEKNIDIRIRPSYFPFTSPSIEVDIWWNGRWLEVLGAGMIHPKISEKKGWALGGGVERLCMVKNGFSDMRSLYEKDLKTILFNSTYIS
jgi:phenylalanyl-tRNA synthetase alpha chain